MMTQSKPIVKMPLGNGDTLALAGAIVSLIQRHGPLQVPALASNLANTRALFASVPDAEIVSVPSTGYLFHIDWQPSIDFNTDGPPKNNQLDQYAFLYHSVGVPYELRWLLSPVFESRKLVPQLPVPKYRYQFLHEDRERGFCVRKHLINQSLGWPTIIRSDTPQLAWCDIIEAAEEIACIDSSFFHLTEHTNPRAKRLTLHQYPRPYSAVWLDYKTRHQWVRLTK